MLAQDRGAIDPKHDTLYHAYPFVQATFPDIFDVKRAATTHESSERTVG
jgi:hypothetical protein